MRIELLGTQLPCITQGNRPMHGENEIGGGLFLSIHSLWNWECECEEEDSNHNAFHFGFGSEYFSLWRLKMQGIHIYIYIYIHTYETLFVRDALHTLSVSSNPALCLCVTFFFSPKFTPYFPYNTLHYSIQNFKYFIYFRWKFENYVLIITIHLFIYYCKPLAFILINFINFPKK